MPDTTQRPNRAAVVELRVHGIGGASARQLLGVGTETEIVQVDGDGTSGFHRLREHRVDAHCVAEAYVWGGLNSKALIAGFWWLLLPFTLVNVAGWMLQPVKAPRETSRTGSRRSGRPWALMITRGLIRLGGVGLTIVYILYLLVLFVDIGAARCGSDPACAGRWWLGPLRWFPGEGGVGHGVWRAAVGLSIVLGLIGLLFGASARNRRLHESVGPVTTPRGPRGGRRWGQTVRLADPTFWYQLDSPGAAYRFHLAAATVTLGFAAGTSLSAASSEDGWPAEARLWWWLAALSVLWCLVIGVLARPDRFIWHDGRYVDRRGDSGDPLRFRLAVVGWMLLHIGLVVVAGLLGWGWRRNATNDDAFAEHGFIELIWWAALLGVMPFIVALLGVGIKRQWGWNLSSLSAFVRQLVKGFDEVTEVAPEPRRIRQRRRRSSGRPPGSGSDEVPPVSSGFRIYAVPVAIGLGLILVFAGFSSVLVRTIALLENSETGVRLGSDRIGGNPSIFAFSFMIAVATVLLWYARPLSRKAARAATMDDYDDLTRSDSPRQHQWVRSVSGARLHARLGRRADVILSLLLLVFAVTLLTLTVLGGGRESAPLFGWEWLETIGSWVFVLFLFPGVFVLRAAFRARDSRQTVGKVWDVLTFWPRVYHPLAAPCYAERAVPELRDRLRRLTDDGGRVVVAAHSQGTVLCYAAVASLAGLPDCAERLERISIVTQGSPIRQLFVPFFPEYFRMGDLRSIALSCDPRGAWVNFYRDTDYIGQHLFGVPDRPGTLPTHAAPTDLRLLDPPRPRLPLRRHIDYDGELLVQEWLARVAGESVITPAGRSPEPEGDPRASRET